MFPRPVVALATSFVAVLAFVTSASAQNPWTVTIRPTAASLVTGQCNPIHIDLLDATGRDSPRSATGMRVSIADFDMSVTGTGVVGRYDGAAMWSACACPKSAGGTATITATYPAKSLATRARVAGVAFETSVSLPVTAGTGSGVPIGCETTKTTTTPASAWTVTLVSSRSTLPIGACQEILIDLRDATGKERPRNPAGMLVQMADFDMSVTGGGTAAGQPMGVSNWSACGCQGAAVGSLATITATYPGRGVAPAAQVPGVAFQSSMTIPLGAAIGSMNPPACTAAQTAPVAIAAGPSRTPVSPPAALPPTTALPSTSGTALPSSTALPTKTAAVATPGPAPIATVTGTSGTAKLEWPTVPGVASYTVTRTGGTIAAVQQTLSAGNLGMFDTELQPLTAYTWKINAIQADGRIGSTTVSFTTPFAVNPDGFLGRQTGNGQVRLSWRQVSDADYYVLFGPGAQGGLKVTDTTVTVTGVPVGKQQWQLASYYGTKNASTPTAEFRVAKLNVTPMLLTGWVDLHTHPMVHLGFGGKLIHGGPDVGSILPTDINCVGGIRATSIAHALSDDRPSHGGWNLLHFPCGDELRKLLLNQFQSGNHALTTASPANGYPDFDQWPKWNDITHQKMWFEWIKRARDGGLRVLVALAVNNQTLGDAMSGGNVVSGSPDGPTDDKYSADLQLYEMEAFVKRHPDFMEIAYSSADIKRIVLSDRTAVVLGVEVDNIGNFNRVAVETMPTAAAKVLIASEIQRLYSLGARYIFPIHVLDNKFGGTAIYEGGFNTSNRREAGHYWNVECADVSDNISHTYALGEDILENVLKSAFALIKLGVDPLMSPSVPPVCPGGQAGKGIGHRNARGLTPAGEIAIREMMKLGMIIDIDHMSQKSTDAVLTIAETYQYPVVSGHTGLRGLGESNAESSRSPQQMERISRLQGMFGLGSDGAHAHTWAGFYQSAMIRMGHQNVDPLKATYLPGMVSFGSDLNGLVKGPKPGGANSVAYGSGTGQIPKSTTGNKSWDYNSEGVAHYGLMWDFVVHTRTAPSNGYIAAGAVPLGVIGSDLVDNHLNRSANHFWQMWERIEARKGSVP